MVRDEFDLLSYLVSKSERTANGIATEVGIDPKTIRDISSSRGKFIAATSKTRKLVSKFLIGIETSVSQIYKASLKLYDLNEESQKNLEKYTGTYESFRLGLTETFVKGEIEIEYNSVHKAWMHFHKSKQDVDFENRTYNHAGPVFHMEGRLYFLAIGHDGVDKYFRSMILSTVDFPNQHFIKGVLLTERHDITPMGAKIVLVKKDSELMKKQNFEKNIVAILDASESKNYVHTAR